MASAAVMIPIAPNVSPRQDTAPAATHGAASHSKGNKPLKALTKATANADGKRTRSERPCDGCRRRKSKCVLNDESTVCVLCAFHKQSCTFMEGPLPRKRKADELLENGASQPGQSTSRQTQPRQKIAKTGLPQVQLRGRPVQRTAADTNATLDDTLSLQRHRHCRYIGPSSALDVSLLGHCHFSSSHETQLASGNVRSVSGGDFFEMLPDTTQRPNEEELQALYEIEQIVAPHGPALVDVYFERVHPSFPIIQKVVFMDKHAHGDRQFSSALLASMYVLALGWWPHEPLLAQYPMPSSEALEDVAFRSLSTAMQQPKLSSLQAGLLLLQKHHSNAWPLTVQLVALSQDLGLHLDCSSWSIPLWERRLRKRLAWAIYMQDKWSSLIYGRPSHIHASAWAVSALTRDEFVEDVDDIVKPQHAHQPPPDATHATIYLQTVELTAIMADILDTFYTQAGISEIAQAGPHATQIILSKAKPVQLRLKEWFARLPAAAKLDAADAYSPIASPTVSAAYLHLAYFAAEISIHKRIVQSLAPSTSSSPASPPSAAQSYTLYICRTAAKTRLISALDFVNRLRPSHLDAFWYFPSAANLALIASFGNLLRATAPGLEEAAFYEMRLREYRWALSVSARRAEWIQEAVEVLDITGGMVGDDEGKVRSRADSVQGRGRR